MMDRDFIGDRGSFGEFLIKFSNVVLINNKGIVELENIILNGDKSKKEGYSSSRLGCMYCYGAPRKSSFRNGSPRYSSLACSQVFFCFPLRLYCVSVFCC